MAIKLLTLYKDKVLQGALPVSQNNHTKPNNSEIQS